MKKHFELTDDELLRQERVNFSAHMALTYRFLIDRGINLNEYITFLGEQFAPGWSSEVKSLDDFQDAILLNVAANGGKIIHITAVDAQRRRIEVSEILLRDVFRECGAPSGTEGLLWDKLRVIAARIGYEFRWTILDNGNHELLIGTGTTTEAALM